LGGRTGLLIPMTFLATTDAIERVFGDYRPN